MTWKQQGFSFIEVLVAMLVLGVSVLGFASLQVRALDSTGVAHTRSQAMTLAAELVERMRANPDGMPTYLTANLYGDPATKVPTGVPSTWSNTCLGVSVSNTGCTAVAMATFDVQEIQYLARESLPDGRVEVRNCAGGALVSCVFVTWGGTLPAACATNATSPECVSMRVHAQ